VGLTLGVALGFFFVPLAFVKTGSFFAAAAWMSLFPILGLALLVVVALGKKPPVVATAEHLGETVNFKHDFKQATKLPVFYFGLLCVFLECWVMQAFNDLTPVYLSAPPPLGAGHGVVLAGKFMGLVQLSIMIGSVASGFLLVRVFKGKNKAIVGMGFIGAAVFALSVRFPFVVGNLKVLAVCLFLMGSFQGLIVPSTLAFVSTNFPSHIVGKLTGLWMGLGILGGTVGIIVGSTLLHHTGFYHASLVTVGIVALAGWLSSFLLTPPRVAFDAANQDDGAFTHARPEHIAAS
jgi:MFS family permease